MLRLVVISEAMRLHRAHKCGCVCSASHCRLPSGGATCGYFFCGELRLFLTKTIRSDVHIDERLDVVVLVYLNFDSPLTIYCCGEVGTSAPVVATLRSTPLMEVVDESTNFQSLIGVAVTTAMKVIYVTAHHAQSAKDVALVFVNFRLPDPNTPFSRKWFAADGREATM